VLWKSPKLSQQPKFLPTFGWANFAGQVLWLGLRPGLWLGHELAKLKIGPVIIGPTIIDPAIFFLILAGLFFEWAENGCGWTSQTGFSPTLIYMYFFYLELKLAFKFKDASFAPKNPQNR